jgi:trehalose synthase-fused probable maltokinase
VGVGRLPRELVSGAWAIARRGAVFEQRAGEAARELSADAGSKTRVHGDYHLGQVLRSGPGEFFIIDFEGEPARPLAERRARHSPLRDVAGMLRSFAYAAAAASGGPGDERAASWERTAREGFLRGYLRETSAATGLLPQSAENTQRLITLFETEKVFYELQYELDHRPDWVWIPLRGIATLNA